jgi:hypothetical protein
MWSKMNMMTIIMIVVSISQEECYVDKESNDENDARKIIKIVTIYILWRWSEIEEDEDNRNIE